MKHATLALRDLLLEIRTPGPHLMSPMGAANHCRFDVNIPALHMNMLLGAEEELQIAGP